MQLLLLLLEQKGQLVTRDQIVDRIWGKDIFVDTDNSINAAIRKIRVVLGDNPEQPRFVQTLTGRGYRFIAPIEEESPAIETPTAATPPLAAENLIGKKVSHYRVLHLLGGGGMGVVYQAQDLKLGRRVAIKFLPSEMASDSNAYERLEREARAASALDHRNICSIYELSEYEGQPFIVMQLLEGQTLQESIEAAAQQEQTLPLRDVLDVTIQLTEGLEAAHDKGIIHRDIKPANIMVSHGEVKILDFGLAKKLEEDRGPETSESPKRFEGPASPTETPVVNPRLTRTGATMGTTFYMSPEQVRGEQLDARTDLFSLGLVLYEMTTCQRAFVGSTAAQVHDAILLHQPMPLRQVQPDLPAELERITSKALEKDRVLRYQSAGEMRTDLQRLRSVLSIQTESAPGVAETQAEPRPARNYGGWARRVRKLAIAAFALVIAGWAASFLYHRSLRARQLSDNDTIVLADFTNTTGDPIFDDTLKQALFLQLSQSPFLNILPEEKMSG
jgi:serine/threonine protein kinase